MRSWNPSISTRSSSGTMPITVAVPPLPNMLNACCTVEARPIASKALINAVVREFKYCTDSGSPALALVHDIGLTMTGPVRLGLDAVNGVCSSSVCTLGQRWPILPQQ